MDNKIRHKARVISINNNKLTLSLTSVSACANCHAKSACTAADLKEKQVQVYSHKHYPVGTEVMVETSMTVGIKAVLYAYVLPIVVALTGLFVYTAIGFSELQSGLLCLGALAAYFIVLSLFRNKLEKNFKFNILHDA